MRDFLQYTEGDPSAHAVAYEGEMAVVHFRAEVQDMDKFIHGNLFFIPLGKSVEGQVNSDESVVWNMLGDPVERIGIGPEPVKTDRQMAAGTGYPVMDTRIFIGQKSRYHG